MIKQRLLGRTSLRVSELCLGTMNFGWKTDAALSFAVLDAYRAAGGNFIQAAGRGPDLLLPSASTSFSEAVVGKWWRARGIPRGELVLATRIHVRQTSASGEEFARLVREACYESLRRLKTTYLDLVIFEWHDQLLPLRVTFDAFNSVVRRGLVRFIGAANFPAWRVAEALGRAYLGNHVRMEVLQADYSLMTRARFEPDVMALCQEQRLGFLARSPLAGGFLARSGGAASVIPSLRRDWLAERFGNRYGDAALAAVSAVADRSGASMAQVALAWVLGNPQVTATVIGVRTPAQLRELVDACSLPLAESDRHELGEATSLEEVRVSAGARRGAPEPMAAV